MATQIATPPAVVTGLRMKPMPSGAAWEERGPTSREVLPAAKEAKKGVREDREDVHRLVVKFIPLVKRVATQMRERLPLHIEMDDLVSTGVLGLVDAVQKFDARKQVKLEQYAQHRIRGAILDGLRELDSASRDMRKKNKSAERVYGTLEAQLGRPPSDHELAKGLGMSLAGWYRTVRDLKPVGMAWLRPMGCVGVKETPVASQDEFPANNEGHQFDACYRREQKEILQQALGRIPERERQVVQLYYHRELTMREIGARLGIDESRVSQLHSSALGHLRKRVQDFVEKPVPPAPRQAW